MATIAKKKPAPKSEAELTADDVFIEQPAGSPEDDYLPDDVAVINLLSELGEDAADVVVRIYREGKGGFKDITLLAEVPVSAFTPIMLSQPPYGGGTFRIHARSRTGFVCNRQLKVEPAPGALEAMRQAAQPGAQPYSPPGAALTAADVARIVAETMNARAPAPSPFAMLAEMKPLFEMMRPAAPVVAPAGNDMAQTLALLGTVLDLSKKINPAAALPINEDGKTDMATAVLLKGMDIFGSAMENAKAQQAGQVVQPAAPAQLQTLPAPTTQPPAPGDPVQLTDEQTEEIMFAKMQLKMVNRKAAANDDPVAVAESFYSMLPDELVMTMGTDPNWFTLLCQLVPECAPYQAWYTAAKDKIVAMANEDGFFADLTLSGDSGTTGALQSTDPATRSAAAADNVALPSGSGNTATN